jgi:multiple sugar transport system ATP-binding protein
MVLVGPSGCGKSTILRILAGLEEVTAGEVVIGDTQVTDLPPKERDIAMVFQNYALYPHMTVEQNLGFGLRLRKTPKVELKRRVDDVATILGLDPLMQRKPGELSGGQRQRVAIARAILADPAVLLLDEATSSLDSESESMIQDGLRALREGRTTFVIAHRLSTIMSADQILVLEAGEIVERGTHRELLALGGRYKQLYDKQFKLERDRYVNPGEELAATVG